MPKVNEAYFENKKNAIIGVAEKICAVKPLYKLTMKDIIKESGLSPGAVYSSFANIDEVIIALVNRLSDAVDFVDGTERILRESDTPEEKIGRLFGYLKNLVCNTTTAYGKICQELITLTTDVERLKRFDDGIRDVQMYRYVVDAVLGVIGENIENGYFSPRVSKESVFALIFAFADGFIKDFIFVKCYGSTITIPHGVTFEEEDLAEAVSDSVIFLLNGGSQQ